MIKILKIILTFSLLFFLIKPVLAKEKINVYFFYGHGCPHCAKEELFLADLKKDIPEIDIYSFEVWENRNNAIFLSLLGKTLNLNISSVPFVIVGDQAFPGFYSDETTGRDIKDAIEGFLENTCTDVTWEATEKLKETNKNSDFPWPEIKKTPSQDGQCAHHCDQGDEECLRNCGCQSGDEDVSKIPEKIRVPFIGEIDIKNFSLPALTILMAGIDGFNPCAMWVLLFLISLLLGIKDRKKMWILGSAFIVSSSLVYFLFLSAWLNLFLFLGFVFWIRIVVAIVALGSGVYYLKEYWFNREGACHVSASPKRRKVFDYLKNIVKSKNFLLALGGIILLAAAVNLVELLCSAGLPAIYTQVLALANLPKWHYYFYLILYILVFMLDDLLIFVIAMSTLKIKAVSSHYARWGNLIGGILMILIGLLLILKPGWLMFG